MTVVYVVVPEGIDDPERPSGGNTYDRRVCRGLGAIGWSVHEHAVPGDWPRPDAAARANLADVLVRLPDDAVVLLDGLIASAVPEVLVPEADRLRLVVLVHMPLDDACERVALRAAAAIVTTSRWTRARLLDQYALRPEAVRVAQPGVDAAELAPGTALGGELLCIAAVTPLKGHEVLLDALAMISGRRVRCVCVGSLTRDPDFVAHLQRRIRDDGLAERICLTGPRTGLDLDTAYHAADLLVLASRAETYGMVVIEALARGIPVIATNVGGIPQTLGFGADGSRPGLLVPPDEPAALAAALQRWLGDADTRQRLRRSARDRRTTLADWSTTADRIARILTDVAA